MNEEQKQQVIEIASEAKMDKERTEKLLNGLQNSPEITKELFAYLENGQFLCETKVAGYSIVDIMIYQIDHFRAYLDRDTTLTKHNPRTMILYAAETMLAMNEDPTKFIETFSVETGTDSEIK